MQSSRDLARDLRARPAYAVILLFATLCQAISLLAFTLALHDLPAGVGVRAAPRADPMPALILTSEAGTIRVAPNDPLENAVRSLLKDPEQSRTAVRPFLRFELPLTTELPDVEAWHRIEAIKRHLQIIAGNAPPFRLHFVHRTVPQVAPTRDRRPSDIREVVPVTAVFAREPTLLDYFAFTASILVNTSHCDMAPLSNFAKMVYLTAGFYEIFFTVIFFGAVVSILFQGHDAHPKN